MIKITGREIISSLAERKIGFENDNKVESRTFLITDPSLVGFSFKLDVEPDNIIDLEKTVSEDGKSAFLLWTVSSGMLSHGSFEAQLRAFNSDTEQVWHSEKISFIVGKSINATTDVPEGTISEFEEIELRATLAKEAAKAYSEAAQASAQSVLSDVTELSDELEEHCDNTENPHSVTKAQLGLSEVDNTSDADKPISTAVETALEAKSDVDHTHPGAFYNMTAQTVDFDPNSECYFEYDPEGMAFVYCYLFNSASESTPKYVDIKIGTGVLLNITINGKSYLKFSDKAFEFHGFVNSRVIILCETGPFAFDTLAMSGSWTDGFLTENMGKEILETKQLIGDVSASLDAIALIQQSLIA